MFRQFNPVPRYTEARSKKRVKQLRAQGCTVKHVELANGDVVVLKKCPTRARNPELIPGGLSSGMKPSDFNQRALARGTKVELEHTSSKKIAREIAMDHLTEDPRYYEKLARMENPLANIWGKYRRR